MSMRKQLVKLANRIATSWELVDFDVRPINMHGGWYVFEFLVGGATPQTPRLIIEQAQGKLIERELIGFHAGRNRMLVYLPDGQLHAISESVEVSQLARIPSWEARSRVLLICGRYLLDFFSPVTLVKMVLLQFRSPFKLSTQLLQFYMPPSETVGHLHVQQQYLKYPLWARLLAFWHRKLKIAVLVESAQKRKELISLKHAPDHVFLLDAADDLADDIDYIMPVSETEHLRDFSILVIKRAIAKRCRKSGVRPKLVYTDHDYSFDQEDGDKVMAPVFKPQPSAAYLHCFAYLGPTAIYCAEYIRTLSSTKSAQGDSTKSRSISLQELTNVESAYRIQLDIFRDVADVLLVDEVLVCSDAQSELTTPPPHSDISHWPDIVWSINHQESGAQPATLGNRLSAAHNWGPQPSVDLIIPTRDGLEVLKPCIDSILEKSSYTNYSIIVVDNGSEKQETWEYLEEVSQRSNVCVVNYPGEFNYSAINNFAASHGDSDYIGLINNDIEVIHADWLEQMMVWAKQPNVGAVGSKLLFGNDLVQHAGVIIGMGNAAGHIHRLEARDSLGYQNRCVATQNLSAVTAACLITPRDVFEGLGGLNEEKLKVAYNDIDYCLRLREQGQEVIWTPEALLYHHESVSRGDDLSDKHISRYFKELGYFQKRWKSKGYVDPYYSKHLRISDEAVYPQIKVTGKDRLRYLIES